MRSAIEQVPIHVVSFLRRRQANEGDARLFVEYNVVCMGNEVGFFRSFRPRGLKFASIPGDAITPIRNLLGDILGLGGRFRRLGFMRPVDLLQKRALSVGVALGRGLERLADHRFIESIVRIEPRSPLTKCLAVHNFLANIKPLNGSTIKPTPTRLPCSSIGTRWSFSGKAYLLADGVAEKNLRNKSEHDILKLSEEARNRGLDLTSNDRELFTFIPTAGEMIDLRYLKVGFGNVPEYEVLDDACRSLYVAFGLDPKERFIGIGFHAAQIARQKQDKATKVSLDPPRSL